MSEEYTVNRKLWAEYINASMDEAFKKMSYNLRTGWSSVVKIDVGCNHEWKRYEGFTDTFEYCTKCEEKKNV